VFRIVSSKTRLVGIETSRTFLPSIVLSRFTDTLVNPVERVCVLISKLRGMRSIASLKKKKKNQEPVMVVHICNPSAWEAEARRL
jgi:hypothetical protein